MTDLPAPTPASLGVRRIDITSDEARARIRARYARERRFRFYGLAAIALTAIFLVVLLSDVVRRGLPAFTTHVVTLDVTLRGDVIDPSGKREPEALRAADYFPLTRDALKAAIPGIESRSGERALTRLLSTGAANALRQRVLDNPSLIGTTVKAPLLLSSDADLYFKGAGTAIRTRPGQGTATLSGARGEVTILSSAADFAADLAAVRQDVAARLRALNTEADRLARYGAADLAARIADLRRDAAELKARLDAQGAETLDGRLPSLLVAIHGGLVKIRSVEAGQVTGDVLLPLTGAGSAAPGSWRVVTYATPESSRRVTDQDVAFLERLREIGAVERRFNWSFLTSGDSREPELAGIRGALIGSALMLLVTLVICLPTGVLAAIYLEEFAPKNWVTDLIEVNINNLAAVPSIVFGLLGLAVFLNFFDLPRSAPLVGGLVLALLVLPTIIIAARAALKAVPPSIKEAALGVGASHQQAVFHHVLPLALPGIMTGTIIGMAHALGETAPLLMIGMVAFIVDIPKGVTDAATVLPVQIYLWSDLPELGFQAKTAAAILVLLAFLFAMNGLAIWLRKRFERRW